MNKKVLLIISSNGFQPHEYGTPKKILEEGGVEVLTASDKKGTAIAAYTGLEVEVNLSLGEVKVEDYNGIFIIGGPGALDCLDHENTYQVMRAAVEQDKLWGAICISPRILAHAGLLNEKRATGWNGDGGLEGIFKQAGAMYVDEKVVVDKNLITGNGPEAVEEFGNKILGKI